MQIYPYAFYLCAGLTSIRLPEGMEWIKREAFYRALQFIGDYYLDSYMSVNEDGLVDFMLLKKAESFIYIKDYGYVYVANPKSVIYTIKKTINKTLRDYFLYLKFLFEKTGNNNHEKAMAGEQLRLVYNKFYKNFKEATENFEFYYEVLNITNITINNIK